MLRVHRRDDPQAVGRAVEEVRVAERDVLGAGRDLLPDVGEDHLARHHPEAAVVHRDDGAVAAEVLAAAARLREPDGAGAAAREFERGVALERGEAASVRNEEVDLVEMNAVIRIVPRSGPDGRLPGAVTGAVLAAGAGAGAGAGVPAFTGKGDERRLDLSAEHRLGSELAEVGFVDRGVQPEHGEPGAGREGAEPAEGGGRDPPRGVHREMDRDESRVVERLRIERLAREVDAAHRKARRAQPRRRLGESERLAAELVGADEDDREGRLPRPRVRAPAPLPPRGTLPAQRLAGGRIPSCGSRCSSMRDPTSTRAPTPRGTLRARRSTADTTSCASSFTTTARTTGTASWYRPRTNATWVRAGAGSRPSGGLDLVVCVAAGQRRGVLDAAERRRHGKDADVLAPGFRIAGLGLLAEAAILADRFVTFG